MDEEIRIDKWLWAVRIFKTRTLATEACRAGKVRINGISVKASREIHSGEIVQISVPPIKKTIKVLELLDKRMAAKNLVGFIEDLTPAEEYDKLKNRHESAFELRQTGTGRPTKKSRREIDLLKKLLGQ